MLESVTAVVTLMCGSRRNAETFESNNQLHVIRHAVPCHVQTQGSVL